MTILIILQFDILFAFFKKLVHYDSMNAKIDSGTPPNKRQINVKQKKESIVNRLTCATLEGVNAQVIEIEATFTKGLPGFAVVGLASSDIQEAKERTKSALLTNDFVFPLKIRANLSPSEPLQDKKVHIARVNAKIEYEAEIMFFAAQNPCPCGNLLSKRKSCRCSEVERLR